VEIPSSSVIPDAGKTDEKRKNKRKATEEQEGKPQNFIHSTKSEVMT